jgi:hypothetical protein
MGSALGIWPAAPRFVHGFVAAKDVGAIDESCSEFARYAMVIETKDLEAWNE